MNFKMKEAFFVTWWTNWVSFKITAAKNDQVQKYQYENCDILDLI